jgi:hypothetical protein
MRDMFILNEIYRRKLKYIFGRHFAWLKYFLVNYHLVPALASNYKQHILSPAKVSFLCHNTPTNKN